MMDVIQSKKCLVTWASSLFSATALLPSSPQPERRMELTTPWFSNCGCGWFQQKAFATHSNQRSTWLEWMSVNQKIIQ
jgi:hypothetical protein